MVGHASYDFDGESAIVTGSTKGIGRGIAAALAEHGANVAINARTPEDVEETASELDAEDGGDVIGITADVGEPEGIEELVAGAIDEFGGIDLLVNNAAVWPRESSMIEATLEEWEYTMNVNVRSQFYASTLVAEHMVDAGIEGNVVNVTSQTGDRRSGPRGLYGVSNTAVNGLTWRMAADYAREGIRVNAVSTDATRSYQLRYEAEQAAGGTDRTADEVLDEWGADRPLGRLGRPGDLADAVCWLASDRAASVVGTILRVSGGGTLM
jgi:NAD(P)-dependent dehydrogenase (short-subunit alcohol dehydrogenase family)